MATTNDFNVKNLWLAYHTDAVVLPLSLFIVSFSCIIAVYISAFLGFLIFSSFATGCGIVIFALQQQNTLSTTFQRIYEHFGLFTVPKVIKSDCNVCGLVKCNRHAATPDREPWRSLFISRGLDTALDSFYTKILNAFVESWFSLLSKNEDFVTALKHILREATCRLILKFKELNIPQIITDKLLPCAINHHEIVQKLVEKGVSIDRLAEQFSSNNYQIHPALRNRQSELDYLRAVAKCLLPRICNNQNLDSKVFFSLGRELLACWVLLPLMDVLANPNWLNAMIIAATDKSSTAKLKSNDTLNQKVTFLANFVTKTNGTRTNEKHRSAGMDTDFLKDPDQLYKFMTFLKREGAVDILRFYLDVDGLNAELMDPKITTDPAKLSALQQRSEKLLTSYQQLMEADLKKPVKTLAEAQEDAKKCLIEKWQRAYHKTPQYFDMVYGSREIHEIDDTKNAEQSGSVSRLVKLKGAIRGAIDGSSLEVTEVPTVWDALTDEPQINSQSNANSNIYNSASQKLRKERGQNLEVLICTFMQSIEQNTDVGEDVIQANDIDEDIQMPLRSPGHSLVFGNLFDLKSPSRHFNQIAFAEQQSWIRGPSQCLIYVLVNIVDLSRIIVRILLGMIAISQKLVDALVCKGIDKLLRMALYEPRLTLLVSTIEEQLFGSKKPEPCNTELLEQQRQAKQRLARISPKFARLADTLQSAALNKQLMYCLFDLIVAELYPELDKNLAKD